MGCANCCSSIFSSWCPCRPRVHLAHRTLHLRARACVSTDSIMDKKRAPSLVLPTSSGRTTDKKIRPSCSSSCSLPDVEPVLPTFVSGPFQRELYNAYEQYFQRYPMFVYGDGVQVRSVNIRDILYRLQDIIRTRDQCEEALARIPWVRFTPGQTQVEFFICLLYTSPSPRD